MAKNAQMMANVEVKKAENKVAYKELSDDAKFNSANGAYASAMAGSIAAGAAVGAGTGALTAGIAGSVVPVIGNVIGAGGGAIIGGIVGAIGGVVAGAAAGEAAKTYAQEKDRDDTDALAKALASGEIMSDAGSIADYLTNTLGYTADEAKELAERFANNADALRDYGEGLIATDA
jgi:gas vesicle protein